MNENSKTNGISTALKICGAIAIVVGVIAGFAFGVTQNEDSETSFNLLTIIATWSAGAIGGLLLMGLGEIVNLLQNLCNRANALNPSADITDNIVNVSKMAEQEYSEYTNKTVDLKSDKKSAISSFFSIESSDSDEPK